jgi:hypothetical protein
MLAVFCLRLALGMLLTLIPLSPRLMHPRFFRTHFLTVLGLSVIALLMGWSSQVEDPGAVHDLASWIEPTRRMALVAAAVLSLLGALVWIYERPPAGWTLLAFDAVAMAAALVASAFEQASVRPNENGVALPALALLAGDLTSAALLGFAITAMLVGHSYLISPGLTIRPLMGQIAGLGLALLARTGVTAAALWYWTGNHDLTNLNDVTVLWLPVRCLIGLVGPAVFGWMTYRTAKIRSTQSATGILYVVVILAFLGELTDLLLTSNTGLPL